MYKDAWAIAVRGETYSLMGRYEDALSELNRALELDDKYTWAIANRGRIYRLMGRFEEALLDFKRALEIAPGTAWIEEEQEKALQGISSDGVTSELKP